MADQPAFRYWIAISRFVGSAIDSKRSPISQRNLVKNGGMLDEVIWVARTTNAADLAWLDLLLKTESSYTRWNVTWQGNDYRSAYDRVEDGTMYIKIDDDVVFIEDSAIPTIVDTKWRHPEYFIVSANIMNQPSLSWVHYHLDAVHPYLPELNAMPNGLKGSGSDGINVGEEVDWRASSLPTWDGPDDFNMTMDWTPTHEISQHRWLPLRPDYTKGNGSMPLSLEDTPIRMTAFDPFSQGLWHWTLAAQQHYSFFQNLEENELWRYKFHTWNYNYTRMGIQFIAIMGDDINAGKPMIETDDEYYFTEVMPKKLKRSEYLDSFISVSNYPRSNCRWQSCDGALQLQASERWYGQYGCFGSVQKLCKKPYLCGGLCLIRSKSKVEKRILFLISMRGVPGGHGDDGIDLNFLGHKGHL
jgi:hypothetical protein